MKRSTRTKADAEIEFAEGAIEEAPNETVNRLRYAFPDLDRPDLLRMALRHPEAIRERRFWQRRIRARRRELDRSGGRA